MKKLKTNPKVTPAHDWAQQRIRNRSVKFVQQELDVKLHYRSFRTTGLEALNPSIKVSEITVRPATLTDYSSLAGILISANERAFRGRVPDACLDSLTPQQSEKNWAKNFDANGNFNQNEYLLVATNKGQVIGSILSATLSKQQKITY